jgi:hypothetical protein
LCMITFAVDMVGTGNTLTSSADEPIATDSVPTATATQSPTLMVASEAIADSGDNDQGVTIMEAVDPTISPILTPTALAVVASGPIVIRAVDTQISADWQPVRPGMTFSSVDNRLYFFIDYEGIAPDARWRQQLLLGDEVIKEQSQAWGLQQAEGETFFFFGDSEGFRAGEYTVQVYLDGNEQPVASTSFTIIGGE